MKLDDPDEEMEELLQDWVNHLVKNSPAWEPLMGLSWTILNEY